MKRLKVKFLMPFFIIALGLPTILWAGEKGIAVEGIVYEPRNPASSFAVIDGEDYQKGSQYQGYEIVEVLQDRVRMKKEDGTISDFRIEGGTAVRPFSKTKQADGSKTVQDDPSENIWQQFKKRFGIEAATLLNYAAEISVKADLRNLYTQASVAYMDHDGSNISLDQLIKDGLVNPAFKEGKNGQQYRVTVVNEGVQVFADPINGPEKSHHFMIDAWGNMRVELGRPATSKSPLVKLPTGLKGLTPPVPQNPSSPGGPEDNSEA